ncbi:MAG: hypothetical protein AB7V42_03085 [Thermoleophilia bacterium]
MRNPLGTLVFGRGELPDALRTELDAERPVLIEEGLSGHVTYRHYRAPGRYSNWRRDWVRAALVVTERRLGVFVRGMPIVNVPFDDPRMRGLDITAAGDALLIRTDASHFNPKASGRVDVLIRPERPAVALERIRRRIRY